LLELKKLYFFQNSKSNRPVLSLTGVKVVMRMLDQLIRAAIRECAARKNFPSGQTKQSITAWIKQHGESSEHK